MIRKLSRSSGKSAQGPPSEQLSAHTVLEVRTHCCRDKLQELEHFEAEEAAAVAASVAGASEPSPEPEAEPEALDRGVLLARDLEQMTALVTEGCHPYSCPSLQSSWRCEAESQQVFVPHRIYPPKRTHGCC